MQVSQLMASLKEALNAGNGLAELAHFVHPDFHPTLPQGQV